MDNKRVEEVMQSNGLIHVSYNGMPVLIERIRGDLAEVTLIGMDRKIDLPTSALAEADPMESM